MWHIPFICQLRLLSVQVFSNISSWEKKEEMKKLNILMKKKLVSLNKWKKNMIKSVHHIRHGIKVITLAKTSALLIDCKDRIIYSNIFRIHSWLAVGPWMLSTTKKYVQHFFFCKNNKNSKAKTLWQEKENKNKNAQRQDNKKIFKCHTVNNHRLTMQYIGYCCDELVL